MAGFKPARSQMIRDNELALQRDIVLLRGWLDCIEKALHAGDVLQWTMVDRSREKMEAISFGCAYINGLRATFADEQ